MKLKQKGFTLIESIISLIIAALVFESFISLIPKKFFHHNRQQLALSLQTAINQLSKQPYELGHVDQNSVVLKKAVGEPVTLKVQNQQLILAGKHHGQEVLMPGVHSLDVQDMGSYQELTATFDKGYRYTVPLFIPKNSPASQIKAKEG